MRIDGQNSYASLTSYTDNNQQSEADSANANLASNQPAPESTGDSNSAKEVGVPADNGVSTRAEIGRQEPVENSNNSDSLSNQRVPERVGTTAQNNFEEQHERMRRAIGSSHEWLPLPGTSMLRAKSPARPRAVAAPPRTSGGSGPQTPGVGGAPGGNAPIPPNGAAQPPQNAPPAYHGQNVSTRQVSGVQYVSVQGGSWLSLNPAVIAGQVTTRFGEFGGNVLGIQDKLRAGGTLTTDDVTALRRYSVVMHALMPLDPLLRKQVELQESNNGGPQIRYLGSVKIRTDYTPAEVIEMTSQALRKPFTSFVKSAQDISNKLNRGEPLSPEEEATIERYAGIADQFRLLTPGGQVMNGVGTLLAGSYSAWEGKPLNREMAREMLDLLNTRVDMRKASAPVSSSSAVPLPKGAPNAPGLNNAPGFKPPTRLPGGRVGYPLGPTKPPRLPATRGTGPQPGPSGVGARASSLAGLGRAQVGELKGKGPLNLRASDSGTPPDQPLGKVGVPFNYYRSDRDVQMSTSQPAEAVPFSQRRDVLTVGTAKEATSYDAKARTYFGNRWDKKSGGLASDTQVIKIDNGREGVGAIFVPFTNIPPGGRLVVTGGALSGCTVMMAANKQGFYAWHAGTDRPGTQWTTANNGAASIVNAHNAMGGGQHVVPTAGGQSSDLLSVAGQYPFSVIVYNGKAQMLPAGATGPAGNKMTSFSYYEPDPRKMALGTAEAVIARDRSGNVVVRVWAEKGALTDPRSVKDGTQTRYTMESGQMSTYEVPASS